MNQGDFRDYHLLLDEHAEQIFAMTGMSLSERARSAELRSAPLATYQNMNASSAAMKNPLPDDDE